MCYANPFSRDKYKTLINVSPTLINTIVCSIMVLQVKVKKKNPTLTCLARRWSELGRIKRTQIY